MGHYGPCLCDNVIPESVWNRVKMHAVFILGPSLSIKSHLLIWFQYTDISHVGDMGSKTYQEKSLFCLNVNRVIYIHF